VSITIDIDDALLKRAQELTGQSDPTSLVRQLVEKEIRQREAGLRLAALGGTMPDLELPPRKRPVG
jgi:Arc/MetJ family transcription regulator